MVGTDIAELRYHAALLGAVYQTLLDDGETLGAWGDIKDSVHHVDHRILNALGEIYPDRLNADRMEEEYLAAFRSVKAQLFAAAAGTGRELLTGQMASLTVLRRRLFKGDVPADIHEVAVRVRQRLNGYSPSPQDRELTTQLYGPAFAPSPTLPDPNPNPRFDPGLQLVFRRRVKAAMSVEFALYRKPVDSDRLRPGQPGRADPRAHRQEVVDLCKVLSVHPAFVDIFEAYAQSADRGTVMADRLVREATDATAKLFVELLASPTLAWRYAPFVLLGVKKLGLQYVEGFPEYAVALARVISEPWYKEPLTVLGLTIALVGFLLVGPAEAGLAAAAAEFAVGFADLVVTGGGASLTFIEEREQDVAAVSGSFNTWKLAEPPHYMESALAAAAALLCAIGLVFSGARVFKALRARKLPKTPVPDPPALRKRLIASPQRRATSAAGNRLLRPQTGDRARFTERQVRPAQPRRDVPRSMAAEDRRLAATGTRGPGDVPTDPVPPKATSTTGKPSLTPLGESGSAAPAQALHQPAPPPGRSTVADSSFPMTPSQREWRGKTVTEKTEDAVGDKLQHATWLPIQDTESEAAKVLSLPGGSPPVTEPVLLKQPIITEPASLAPTSTKSGKLKAPLGSAQPDFVLLTPEGIEVFEVTMDSRFQLFELERGTQFRGTTPYRGDPHKAIQVAKADFLIKRYPNMRIVYNIQTIGQVPKETIDTLRALALRLQRTQRALGTGEFQIILRANTVSVIP